MGAGASARDFHVGLAIDGTHYRKRVVDGVGAGESVDAGFSWDAEGGPHTFTATADSGGVIAEIEEGNNIRSVDYDDTVLADLAVQGGAVSVNPDSPTAGDEVTIGLTVLNRSRSNSGRFTVSLYVERSNEPHSSERLNSLEGRDASRYVRFKWLAVQGCYGFRVVVDSGDDVVEWDEDNNQVGPFEICVGAKPES